MVLKAKRLDYKNTSIFNNSYIVITTGVDRSPISIIRKNIAKKPSIKVTYPTAKMLIIPTPIISIVCYNVQKKSHSFTTIILKVFKKVR